MKFEGQRRQFIPDPEEKLTHVGMKSTVDLKTEISELENQLLSYSEVGNLVQDISQELNKITNNPENKNEYWNNLLVRVINRIKQEIGDIWSLRIYEINDGKLKFQPNILNNENLRHQAVYSSRDAVILYKNLKLDALKTILKLLERGVGSMEAVLYHEMVHSFQFEEVHPYSKNYERVNDFVLLSEIHAWLSMGNYTDIDLIIKLGDEGYRAINSAKDRIKVKSIARDIYRLYALGLSDEGIGVVIRNAKWKPENESYDNLSAAVLKLMELARLSNEQLEEMVVQFKLKRKAYFLKVRRTSQNVLIEFLKELRSKTSA